MYLYWQISNINPHTLWEDPWERKSTLNAQCWHDRYIQNRNILWLKAYYRIEHCYAGNYAVKSVVHCLNIPSVLTAPECYRTAVSSSKLWLLTEKSYWVCINFSKPVHSTILRFWKKKHSVSCKFTLLLFFSFSYF